ncbi:SCO2522 family protein [Paractinoplanes toevensis]|uniref:Uncharacterized protein n=1 Tax=Paractinoplanes toevensis TaxID=571911 RepID=A0A919VY00_9ACTN|nr:SCO2522 family protein [Actinoplanes toevensis]GIM88457.1 hypothetical protein Ato02nite_002500 [Actinoplanes toevensis]
MTASDGLFTEASASPVVQSVALSHLSVELGHLYMDDFRAGEARLREHFQRVAPWARTAIEQTAASLGSKRTPRVSTCFLIDDYFTRFSTPAEVIAALVTAAEAADLRIDYVARESGCARAGDVDLATLVQEHLVHEPAEDTNGGRPPTTESGWLTNGERSPARATSAMSGPREWRPPRQSAVQNHSIFVDIELWSDSPDGRLWSCPFLATVWQLQRLGLLRHLGRPVAEPVTVGELPADWDEMPPIIQLDPAAAPLRAYRTFNPLDSRFLPIELAVRTVLSQVWIDPVVDQQVRGRAQAEGVELPAELVGRVSYAFM